MIGHKHEDGWGRYGLRTEQPEGLRSDEINAEALGSSPFWYLVDSLTCGTWTTLEPR